MKHVNSNSGRRVRSMALIVGLLAILFGASALFTSNAEAIRSEFHTSPSTSSPTSVPTIRPSTEVSTTPSPSSLGSVSPTQVPPTVAPGDVTPTPSPSVAPTDAPSNTPAPIESSKTPSVPSAAAPVQLAIPAANIDVVVHPMGCVEHINPPEYDAAYWCTNYGKPGGGSTDTTYLVGHSNGMQEWQFNRLSSQVRVGDRIELTTLNGQLNYQVDDVFVHPKPTLKSHDLWSTRPGHLYIISSHMGDLRGENIVISAAPVK